MLPRGVKSLAEISELSKPEDRAKELGGLLEHILRKTTPNGRGLKFVDLLRINEPTLPNSDQLKFAREARNDIVHGDRVTPRAILQAEAEFQFAIEHVLPSCPDDIRQDVLGKLNSTATQPSPIKPSPTPTDPPSPPAEPEPVAAPPPTTIPPAPPRQQSHSGRVWFILAAAFLLVAAFAYVVRLKHNEPPRTAGVQAAPPVSPQPTPQNPAPALPAPTEPKPSPSKPVPPTREEQFAKLINTNLSISTSQPNVAVAIVASGPGNSASAVDALQGSLGGANLHLIFNLADISTLVTAGFLDDMYSGDGRLASQAAQLSRVDYILLGKASYSFRRQPNLDPDLLTCDLTFACRLIDRAGTAVQSNSFTAPGPGFTESKALEAAAVNVGKQVKEKVFSSIR